MATAGNWPGGWPPFPAPSGAVAARTPRAAKTRCATLSPISWATAHCRRSGRSAGPMTIVPRPSSPRAPSASRTNRAGSRCSRRGPPPVRAARPPWRVDRRTSHAGLPEHAGRTGVQRRGGLFGWDFREHGRGRGLETGYGGYGRGCVCLYTIFGPDASCCRASFCVAGS